MLFKQINILDENLKLQEDCYVAVRNGKIVSISTQRPAGEWEREYDGRGKLLMSGFYNAHAHSPMTLMRGYGENLKLQDWLNKKIFPFEAKLDGNAVYWGTMLALAESFRFGIVSTSDMYYFCDDMARAFADSGAKGNIARSIANVTGEDPRSLVSMQETKDFYRDYNGAENGRILVRWLITHAASIRGCRCMYRRRNRSMKNASGVMEKRLRRIWRAAGSSMCQQLQLIVSMRRRRIWRSFGAAE